ncbi:MAG: hypothetical protein ACTHKV_08540 [Flavipsychrobacter sp.]
MSLIFTIIIGLLTVYSTFLTTKGGLTDNRFNGFWRKLTRRGKLVLLLGLATIILLGAQAWYNDVKSDQKDEALKKERDKRDSTITAGIRSGVDSGNKKLFDNLSIALGKQNLQLDTLSKSFVALKDSVSKLPGPAPIEDPVILIRKDGISLFNKTDTSVSIRISLTAAQASATNISINCFFVVTTMDGITNPGEIMTLGIDKRTIIPKDQSVGPSVVFNSSKEIKLLQIAMKGSYTGVHSKKVIPLREVFEFSAPEKATIFKLDSVVNEFFTKYGLDKKL